MGSWFLNCCRTVRQVPGKTGITTDGLRPDWKNKGRLQTFSAAQDCFTSLRKKPERLNWGVGGGGWILSQASKSLKFISGQENIYSRKCGAWDNVTQNLKTQSGLLWECKFMQNL